MRSAGLALILLAAACQPRPDAGGAALGWPPEIRVRLQRASGRSSVRIAVRGRYRIVEDATGRESESGAELSRRVQVRGAVLARPLRIVPEGSPVLVDGRPYPGSLVLVPREGGLDLVVTTDLESYLVGVLGGELGPAFPLAALRAQAIAARSYALFVMRERGRAKGYDVRDDQTDQVFGGLPEPRGGPLTRAVEDTRGMVLHYRSRVLKAFYHSTCGGHTADKREVFGGPAVPPLAGVPCAWCSKSKYYRWTSDSLTAEDVQRALGLPGPPIAAGVAARHRGRRASSFRFRCPDPVEMSATEVRDRLGPAVLRSTLVFEMRVEGGRLRVSGGGWGHGVGMCQIGASGMAAAGASAADILAHYYPGADLLRRY